MRIFFINFDLVMNLPACILFVICVYTSVMLSAFAKLQSFKKFEDSGYPIGTLFLKEKLAFDTSSKSAMHCGTLCMYTPTCIGYFFRENEFCKLVSSTVQHSLVSMPGTTYFQRQDPCLVYHNPCKAGKCTSNFHDFSYTCLCPDGIIGDSCNEIYTFSYFVDDASKDAQYKHDTSTCYAGDNFGVILYKQSQRFSLVYRLQLTGISHFNVIQSAKIYTTLQEASSGFSYDVKIKAMKRVDSTNVLQKQCDFIDDNLRTTTEVIWKGPHPSKQVGDVIETPDISPILNDVISMDGWQEGNHVDIIFFNDDLPDSSSGENGYVCETLKTATPKLVVSIS